MVAVTVVLGLLGAAPAWAADSTVWSQFGGDAAHSGVNPGETTLTAASVHRLTKAFDATLPGVADAPVVYRSGISTASGVRNLVFAHTRDGWTVALDGSSGARVWAVQVAAGSCRINNGSSVCYTTSSPVLDPSGSFVYSYGLDGRVHKYASGTGAESLGGGWPELTTTKPYDEKGSASPSIVTSHGVSYLFMANGGYPGDRGDYQGHVTSINLSTGAQRVFNTLCSNSIAHFGVGTCPQVQSAVWARGGVTYDPATDLVYLATGNGDYNPAAHDWGDTVLALHPDGSGSGSGPVDAYTPANYQHLQDVDADLGSTAPEAVPAPRGSNVANLGVQSGKDAQIRLLNLANLSGRGVTGVTGGELQIVPVPQGGEVLTQPISWTDPSGTPWVFVANNNGLSGLAVTLSGASPRLSNRWTIGTGGTTPVLAGGVLYYLTGSGLHAIDPRTGGTLWAEPSYSVGLHWQSPIVVAGKVYYPDGNGKVHAFGLPPVPVSACTARPASTTGSHFAPGIASLRGTAYEIAFPAWDNRFGCLTTIDENGSVVDHGLGLMAGTSAAITGASGGYQIAFQANTGELWTTGVFGTRNWGLGMKAGTSPSIAAGPGGYQIAFQANSGSLWTAGPGGVRNWALGLAPDASPAVAAVPGGYQVAFRSNRQELWTTGNAGLRDFGVGLETDPGIASVGGSYSIAYNVAHTVDAHGNPVPGRVAVVGPAATRDLGLATIGRPVLTAVPGGFQVAVQAPADAHPPHGLWVAGSLGFRALGLGTAGGYSITGMSGGYQIAFQSSGTGIVWTTGAAGTKSFGTAQSGFVG